MKFSDGYWLNREGVRPYPAVQVVDTEVDARSLTVYAPCQPIRHRGDTLNLPLLTLRFSSPMEGVIRVQAYQHKGGKKKKPSFALKETHPHVEIQDDGERASLTSGQLTVTVNKADGSVDYSNANGRLTGSGWKGLASIDTDWQQSYMRQQLDIGVGESVYGLGERFTPFVKNGQTVDIWNKDGGTSSEQAYKNIPFYMTNKGYGVFVNHPEWVSYEVGSENVSTVQFSVEGNELDYMIIDGPEPKNVLERYTTLTGKPTLPPAWSFGLWLTTSFTTDYNEETVQHFVNGMAERDLELSVFHFDCFWMKAFEWCNFEWDRDAFPEPEKMLRRLKEKGLKISLWINPYIAQKSPLFDEGAAKGYLLKKRNGDVWQWDFWQAGMGIVDFTNPDACTWYADQLRALLDMGVDCFKTDFGERIPTDVDYYDGSDPQKMHNYYTQLYNELVFNVLKERKGEGEAVLFARSATAGGQQFPVHWGGDCYATYDSMAESLRGGLSLMTSGFGYWSHDIGGFEGTATPDLYKRWTAFGLLSTHSRLHGNESYRVPWLFDDEAVAVTKHFTRLKSRLMPYLYSEASETATTGIPMMRPMMLAFPDDPACDGLDRQYMLGTSLLVAPVFSEDGRVSYYLPQGTWTHFLTGERVEGGTWRREGYDYMSLPLFVRENSVVVVGDENIKPQDYGAANFTLQLFAIQDDARISKTVVDANGSPVWTAEVRRDGQNITVSVAKASQAWPICLRSLSSVRSVENGTWQRESEGVVVYPETAHQSVTIVLNET